VGPGMHGLRVEQQVILVLVGPRAYLCIGPYQNLSYNKRSSLDGSDHRANEHAYLTFSPCQLFSKERFICTYE